MALSYVPVQKGKHVRVWFALNGLNPLEDPRLDGYMIPDQVSFNQTTEVVKKKVPSPTQRGKFETIYTVTQRSDVEISTSLIQRLPANMRSVFVKLATQGCKFDMIWAYGVCTDPNNFNDFDKLEVFEGVSAANYQHDTTGAFDETTLTDDVLETLEVVADDYYEVADVDYRSALTAPAGTFQAVTLVDAPGCGDDEGCIGSIRTDGTARLIALREGSGFWFLDYSEDGGRTWTSVSTAIADTEALEDIAVASGKIILTGAGLTNGDECYWYDDLENLFDGVAPAFTAVNDAAQAGYGVVYVGDSYIYFGSKDGQILELATSAVGSSATEVAGDSAANAVTSMDGIGDTFVAATGGAEVYFVTNNLSVEYDYTADGIVAADTVAMLDEQSFIVVDAGTAAVYGYEEGVRTAVISQAVNVAQLDFATGAVGLGAEASNVVYTANAARSFIVKTGFPTLANDARIKSGDKGNFFIAINSAKDELIVMEDALRQTYGVF